MSARQRLTTFVSGTDETVRQYLFGLSDDEAHRILEAYGEKYGQGAEQYALDTMAKWRVGQVQMSGQVSYRLFQIVPLYMPLTVKYQIAEELWRRTGTRSSRIIRFGKDARHSEIVRVAENHINREVISSNIPDSIEKEFDWLTANDIKVKQQVLNHLRGQDRKLIIDAVHSYAASMLRQLSGEDSSSLQTYKFTHTITVGNHKLTLVADRHLHGDELKADLPRPGPHKSRTSEVLDWLGGIFWIAVTIGVLVFLFSLD